MAWSKTKSSGPKFSCACCPRRERLRAATGTQSPSTISRAPAPRRAATRAGGPLSARELDVARLVAEGLTNGEIAERLVVSPRTVTTHLDNIYTRLNISGRAALARYVVETGLMGPAAST